MEPFSKFPSHQKARIQHILTDIDDTLTYGGRLTAIVFTAMERLRATGLRIFPITGRPARWCDHIARMWPVDGQVGENGAFYFRYDRAKRKMIRRYWKTAAERVQNRGKLELSKAEILEEIPECIVSADQAYREPYLAIDYC